MGLFAKGCRLSGPDYGAENSPGKINKKRYPPMTEEGKRFVYGLLAEDITKLEYLLKRDLSIWKP